MCHYTQQILTGFASKSNMSVLLQAETEHRLPTLQQNLNRSQQNADKVCMMSF